MAVNILKSKKSILVLSIAVSVLVIIIGIFLLLNNKSKLDKTASAMQLDASTTIENSQSQVKTPDNASKAALQTNESKQEQSVDTVAELVYCKVPVQHIFFHPLIAYPELAFNDYMAKNYNDWFVTVSEFNKILESLYEKNFILIGTNELYDEHTENGKKVIAKRQFLLPKNKKPLIISVDDLNYYDYMIKHGNVHKLILDSNNNIATFSVSPKGEKVIAYDNEIIPILDEFVKKHPDFSFHNAKGLIALTGYQGVLGYRTNLISDPNYESEKSGALGVIKRLKETGWSFASHGYGHLDAKKISYTRFVTDTQRWKNEIETLIGSTNIYIYPYGSSVQPSDPKFKFLVDSGFEILYAVGPTTYAQFKPNYIAMDRRHIDGIALHAQKKSYLDLFDSDKVIDPDL